MDLVQFLKIPIFINFPSMKESKSIIDRETMVNIIEERYSQHTCIPE